MQQIFIFILSIEHVWKQAGEEEYSDKDRNRRRAGKT